MQSYIIKTKPSQCITGIIVGAVMLFIGLDLRFTHIIPGGRIESEFGLWASFIIFSGLGLLFLKGSIKELFSPSVILRADSLGITVYSGGSSKVWDSESQSWVTTRAQGDSKTIPWDMIHSIGEGIIYQTSSTHWEYRVTRRDNDGATTIGKLRTIPKKCLQILVDSSIKLDGFKMGHASKAWNGYTEEEIRTLPKQERKDLEPEDIRSGYVLKKEYLKDSLADTIRILQELRDRNT